MIAAPARWAPSILETDEIHYRRSFMKRHIVTVLFLVAAIVFYAAGAVGPGTGLLVLGLLAEGTFWYRIFGKRK